MKDLEYYMACFGALHTNVTRGKKAPHKALLLLSVIDLIDYGFIRSPQIPLSDLLVKIFDRNSRTFYSNRLFFKPKIQYPFYHMQSEPFWRLVAKVEAAEGMAAEGAAEYGSVKNSSPSTKKIREQYSFAEIDRELFDLLQNQEARAVLRTHLISTYLNNQHDMFRLISLPLFLTAIAI